MTCLEAEIQSKDPGSLAVASASRRNRMSNHVTEYRILAKRSSVLSSCMTCIPLDHRFVFNVLGTFENYCLSTFNMNLFNNSEEVSAKPVNERPGDDVATHASTPQDYEMNANLMDHVKEHRKDHNRDEARRVRHESAKRKKRRQRARRRGLRPEGSFESLSLMRSALKDKIDSLVRPATPADTEVWLREVERLKASIPFEADKMQFEMIDTFIKVTSYIVFLSSCKDLAQARDLTINTAFQNFSSEKVASVFDKCMEYMRYRPEGTGQFSSWYKQLESVTLTIAETPLGKFLFNIFSVMVVHGFSVSKTLPECQIQELLLKVENDLYKRSGPLTYLECLLSILEYIAGSIDHIVSGGKISSYLFPQCLHTMVVEKLDEVSRLLLGSEEPGSKDRAISLSQDLKNLEARLKIAVECKYTNARLSLVYNTYYKQVKKAILDVTNFERNTSFRKAPICIFFVGPSQIGKSSLYPLVINAIGVANGRRYSENEVASLSEMSKYDDAIRQNTKIVKMDDVSSVKIKNRDFGDLAISKVIGINQSIPTATNQSQAEKKDAIYHNEDALLGSSNVIDLGILEVFNTCEAAFNRVNIYQVSVMPEYANADGTLNKKKMIADTVNGIPPEAHFMQKVTWKRVPGGAKEYIHSIDPFKMKTGEFIKHITCLCREHVQHQESLYRNQVTVTRTPLCAECGCPDRMCSCEELVRFDPNTQALRAEGFIDRIVFEQLDNFSLEVLRWSMRYFGYHIGSGVAQLLQRNALRIVALFVRIYVMSIYRLSHLWARILLIMCISFLSYNIDVFRDSWFIYSSVLAVISIMLYFATLGYGMAVQSEITENVSYAIIQRSNRTVVVGGVLFLTALGTLRQLSNMISSMRYEREESRQVVQSIQAALPSRWKGEKQETFVPDFDPEGNLSPKTMDDVYERQKETSDWERVHLAPLNMDTRASTMTPDHLINVLEKNMYRVRFPVGHGRYTSCNLLFLEDNVAIASRHVYERCTDKEGLIELIKNPTVNWTARIVYAWAPTEQKDSDIIFLQFSRCGSMNSLSHLLTDDNCEGVGYVVRKHAGSGHVNSTQARFLVQPIRSNHPEIPDKGYTYSLNPGTQLGDCGAVCFTLSRPLRIFGTHCAGNGSNVCVASFLRKSWFEEFKAMAQVPPPLSPEGDVPLPFAVGSEVDTNPYGEQVLTVDPVMEMRSCIAHYPAVEAGGVHPRGFSTPLRVTGFSEVRYSELAAPMRDLGVRLLYGPPKMNSNRDHAETFAKRMEPMGDIKASLLRHAIHDYTSGILDFMTGIAWGSRSPLTLYEALNGIPGNRFIGPIDETTAAGFGIKGKKTGLIEVSYDDTGRKILLAKGLFSTKVEEQLFLLRQGKRLNPVVKTSVKDEGVKVDEEGNPIKTNRIFFTMPADTLCLSKMLFAPVLEVIGSCPLVSECAAGVNVTRNDWGQLRDHLTFFGPDKIMEGDYSGWDVRLSGQLIRAAGLVCIHIARHLGYHEADIRAMDGIISDLATTHVVYNGAICLFDGWMPSGSFVTLAFNSICNSLLHRCAFFRAAHEGTNALTDSKFRSHVHLITMGDDSVAGVAGNVFSMYDMQIFCSSLGIKYTCGDKSEVDRPYIHANDMSFCKRKWYWCEEIEQWLAPLALDSILKSIYLTRVGPLDARDILVQQVDAALRELARHPRDVFDNTRNIIVSCCRRVGLENLVPKLHWSYDHWIEELNARYFLGDSLDETILFEFDEMSI